MDSVLPSVAAKASFGVYGLGDLALPAVQGGWPVVNLPIGWFSRDANRLGDPRIVVPLLSLICQWPVGRMAGMLRILPPLFDLLIYFGVGWVALNLHLPKPCSF